MDNFDISITFSFACFFHLSNRSRKQANTNVHARDAEFVLANEDGHVDIRLRSTQSLDRSGENQRSSRRKNKYADYETGRQPIEQHGAQMTTNTHDFLFHSNLTCCFVFDFDFIFPSELWMLLGAQIRQLIETGVIVDKSKYQQRKAWKTEQVLKTAPAEAFSTFESRW